MLLVALADLGVRHVGALEELGVHGAGHQHGDGHVRLLQLVAQGKGEAVHKGFGAVVDRLERPRHQPGDGAGQQDLAAPARPHLGADLVEQADGARDVGVHDMHDVVPVLVQEGMAEAVPRVGGQGVDRRVGDDPALGRRAGGAQHLEGAVEVVLGAVTAVLAHGVEVDVAHRHRG